MALASTSRNSANPAFPRLFEEAHLQFLSPFSSDQPISDGLMESSFSNNSPPRRPMARSKVYPRRRAIRACQNCRARRTKCDNQTPACSGCLDLQTECVYVVGDPSNFDAASLAILDKLNTLEQLLREKDLVTGADEGADEEAASPSPPRLFNGRGSLSAQGSCDDFLSHINVEAVLAWPVFKEYGFDSHLDLKRLLQAKNDGIPPASLSMTVDVEHVDCERLQLNFLKYIWIFNPIVEEAKVRKYMRDVRFNGLGWGVESCLLLLIYAHGSIAVPFGDGAVADSAFRQSMEFRQAESFFVAAQKRLGMLLCKSGVAEAQCFFLAGVYLMSTLRPIEAWKMFVQALACCEGFYSRHCANDRRDDSERRLQENLYWTCFKSELELRLELDILENNIWGLTHPGFFPSPPEELKVQDEAVWYFYLAEMALRRLGNRILNHINERRSSDSMFSIANSISYFEKQADSWMRTLPPILAIDSPSSINDTQLTRNLKFILNGHLLDCYETMYWPFLAAAINSIDTVPNTIRSSSLDGATIDANSTLAHDFAQKGLDICVQRIHMNAPGFRHRHHGVWLMLRSCTRSALVLMGATITFRSQAVATAAAASSLQMPAGWEEAVGMVVGLLRFWNGESGDVADRLRVLESLAACLEVAGAV